MPWLQLSLETPRHQAAALAALLERAGALAVTYGDAGDEPQLEPDPGATPLWSEVTLTGLFALEPVIQETLAALAANLRSQLGIASRITRLEDRLWERVWLETFTPRRFGQRLWICPRDQAMPDPQGVAVTLDPGLAFGTGHHATTALCLEWLDGAALQGQRLLDFGCGSGILAIAALRLGAASAVAVDHDPQALEATAANAAVNDVEDQLHILPVGTSPRGPFDLVLANILAGPLIALAPQLIEQLAADGRLVLSGILAEQVAAVSAAYAGAIQFEAARYREDWALLCGTRC